MSARGVQRVVDRLIKDARYRRSFSTDFQGCIAGFELTPEERKLLSSINTTGADFAAQIDNILPDVVGQWGDTGWENS